MSDAVNKLMDIIREYRVVTTEMLNSGIVEDNQFSISYKDVHKIEQLNRKSLNILLEYGEK